MTETPLSRAVANVEVTTIAIGLAGALYEFAISGWRSAVAIAVGAVVSWLNYRWLRSGVKGLVPVPSASETPGELSESRGSPMQPAPQFGPSSGRIFALFVARISLLLIALYVILSRSLLPSVPLLAGLFASVAAVLVQMVYLLTVGRTT